MSKKKKLKRKIKVLKKEIKKHEQRNYNKKEKQEQIFEKYSFDYANEPNIDIRNANISRQRYVYNKINKKNLENTAIEKLLDMTLEDIECQHTIKTGIENKSGFILALWGILVATIVDNNVLLESLKKNLAIGITCNLYIIFSDILAISLAVSLVFSLYYIFQSIRPHTYKKFMFDEKEINFKSAVDDKNITYMTLLDNVTNSWCENRSNINKIATNYDKAVKWTIAFAIDLILCFCILV